MLWYFPPPRAQVTGRRKYRRRKAVTEFTSGRDELMQVLVNSCIDLFRIGKSPEPHPPFFCVLPSSPIILHSYLLPLCLVLSFSILPSHLSLSLFSSITNLPHPVIPILFPSPDFPPSQLLSPSLPSHSLPSHSWFSSITVFSPLPLLPSYPSFLLASSDTRPQSKRWNIAQLFMRACASHLLATRRLPAANILPGAEGVWRHSDDTDVTLQS